MSKNLTLNKYLDMLIDEILSDKPTYEKDIKYILEYKKGKDIRDVRKALNNTNNKKDLKKELGKVYKLVENKDVNEDNYE